MSALGERGDRAPGLRERVTDDLGRQPWSEPRRLSRPVRRDARRRDDEEGPGLGIALAGVANEGERLQRLAEAHVVGEDAAELEIPERGEPAESVALVGAQLRPNSAGHLVARQRVEVEERSHRPLPALGLGGDDAERGELGPQVGLVAADPQRRRRRVGEGARLLDERAQRLQPGIGEGEMRAVIEQHPRLPVGERGEHRDERHLATLDGNGHAEVKPIPLAGQLGG